MIRQIVPFFVLTLILTVILGGGQEATGLLTGHVILAQLAPGLAGVILALIFSKDAPGLNFSVTRITLKSVAGAVLLPVGAALVVLLIATLITRAMRLGGVDLSASPVSLIGMIIGAVGEETGWRGFLHRRLDQRLDGLVSSLIVGIPWALWHIGLYQNGPLYMGFLVLLIASYTVVLYVLVEPISFNIWIAALFHLFINITNVVFLSVINDTPFIIGMALVWVAIAAAIVMMNRETFLGAPRSRAV
ncbi:MAG: CPBP family intramembrane metalloprotease [Acidobacteriota bacterium]|nr:CPBP family intramembrane metalloprotease [Acidobacteriota bacterium]